MTDGTHQLENQMRETLLSCSEFVGPVIPLSLTRSHKMHRLRYPPVPALTEETVR